MKYIPFFLMVFLLVFQFSCVTKERDEVVVNSNSRDLINHSNTHISNEEAGEYFKKGLIYVEKEKFEKALPLFHKANKIEKNNVVILNAISQSEFQLGNQQKSIKISHEILAIDSSYVMTYANMGSNYIKLKEFGKAIDIMKLGLNFLGNNNTYADSVLLLNLAVASNKKGDFENGLLYADEVLKISKNNQILDYAQKTKIESMENLGMTNDESS